MAHRIECKDHLGNVFSSKHELYNHYGISDSCFDYRINKLHMTLEEALTADKRDHLSTAIECCDHLGNTFPSKKIMCEYWKIPRTVFFRRIRDGWSLEDALTKPIRTNKKSKQKIIVDHLGNEFINIDEMCAFHNISKSQYTINIRNNCSIEEALTLQTKWTTCRDHLGNEYSSINEMCRKYNTSKHTIRSRIELGWTLKEILEHPQKITHHKKCKDHLGNEFETQIEMLNYYGVAEATFNHRIKEQNMSLEEALQVNNAHKIKCLDHKGNEFESIQDMCDYYNIPTATYHHRRGKLKWSIEKTLTTISKDKFKSFGKNLIIKKQLSKNLYLVSDGNNDIIYSHDMFIAAHQQSKNVVLKMRRNLKIFDAIVNQQPVKIVAVNEASAIRKFQTQYRLIPNKTFIGEISEYTDDILRTFKDKLAGIYT